jgi:hypothetical protein
MLGVRKRGRRTGIDYMSIRRRPMLMQSRVPMRTMPLMRPRHGWREQHRDRENRGGDQAGDADLWGHGGVSLPKFDLCLKRGSGL